MQSYKKYYIPYRPKANINYIYLLNLYKIAEKPVERRIKQDIGYKTIKELLSMINSEKIIMSEATLRRVLNNKEYEQFFEIKEYGSMKQIILKNDFRSLSNDKKPFVVLCPKTYELLIQEEDNLLAKYTIYLKYMCGLNKGSTDVTADQFLNTFGYSIKSHNMKDQLCKYNTLLEEEEIVRIKRNMLEDGKRRNTYTFIDLN